MPRGTFTGPAEYSTGFHGVPRGMRAQDAVSIDLPLVLRDRLASHRLHPRMALYEVVEEALLCWESMGGWAPFKAAPVD